MKKIIVTMTLICSMILFSCSSKELQNTSAVTTLSTSSNVNESEADTDIVIENLNSFEGGGAAMMFSSSSEINQKKETSNQIELLCNSTRYLGINNGELLDSKEVYEGGELVPIQKLFSFPSYGASITFAMKNLDKLGFTFYTNNPYDQGTKYAVEIYSDEYQDGKEGEFGTWIFDLDSPATISLENFKGLVGIIRVCAIDDEYNEIFTGYPVFASIVYVTK